MNGNLRLAVVGARKSGKTTFSLALSHLIGLPRVHAKTIQSIAHELFPGHDMSSLQPHQLLSLGLARYTDRVVRESEAENGFISDGSVLNEVIYGSVRMKMSSAESGLITKLVGNTFLKPAKIIGKRIYNEYSFCLKYHAETSYDALLYLDWSEVNSTPLTKKEREFRVMYSDLLLTTLEELKVPYHKLTGDMEQRLEQALALFSVKGSTTTEKAIAAAQNAGKNLEQEYHYA